MYSQLIKVQCNAGQEAATKLALDRYLKAARLNPGFIHGSFFLAEPHPGNQTPPGFGIKERERTFFVYLAFRSSRDMLKHVELYHGSDDSLLPSPHDYLLGAYNENDQIDVENRYQ